MRVASTLFFTRSTVPEEADGVVLAAAVGLVGLVRAVDGRAQLGRIGSLTFVVQYRHAVGYAESRLDSRFKTVCC